MKQWLKAGSPPVRLASSALTLKLLKDLALVLFNVCQTLVKLSHKPLEAKRNIPRRRVHYRRMHCHLSLPKSILAPHREAGQTRGKGSQTGPNLTRQYNV